MKEKEHPSDVVQHDAFLRQRNIVYPDTVRNEFEGYRHLLSARKISTVQKVGAFILGLLFLLLGIVVSFASLLLPRMAANEVHSRTFGAAMLIPALAMTAIGIAFAVFGFRLLKRAVQR